MKDAKVTKIETEKKQYSTPRVVDHGSAQSKTQIIKACPSGLTPPPVAS